jgi:signal transduction histidine kinase/DNA-binding LacI/PurR family transcriptional regulator
MKHERLRFAYIARDIIGAGGIGTDTPKTIWLSVYNECRRQNISLSTFIGSFSGAGLDNFTYDLLSTENIDGIISWASTDESNMKKIVKTLPKVPIVTLSVKLPDIPCARLDNISGMTELIEHVIQVHKKNKIAFIQGPFDHSYAKERLKAYKETLKKNAIPLDQNLISGPGEWDLATGEAALKLFFDERKLLPGKDIEALICVNDRIAVAVIEDLKRRGYRCPDDIIVCGYNNQEEAKNHTPSISSVSMPFRDQGAAAVIRLKEMLENKADLRDIRIPTRIAIHESCGCPNPLTLCRTPHCSQKQDTEQTLANITQKKYAFIASLHRDIFLREYDLSSINTPLLFDFFFNSIKNGQILPEYTHRLIYPESLQLNTTASRRLISLFMDFLYSESSDSEVLRLGEAVASNMICILTDLDERKAYKERMVYIAQEEKLQFMDRELTIQEDIEGVSKVLFKHLPNLGVPAAYLVLFEQENSTKRKSPQRKLRFAFEQENLWEIPQTGIAIPSNEIFPSSTTDQYAEHNYVIRPLSLKQEKLGYIVLKLGPLDGHIYEFVSQKLNSTIKNVYMKHALVLQSEKTSMVNEKLKSSIKMLKDTQKQLIESEKMASLGSLVAGIAHEINTPVGIGVTISTMLEEKIKHFETLFKNNELTVQEFENYLRNAKESVSIISTNMHKAAHLIQSFKQIAVDQSDEVVREFYIGKYIDDILVSLHPLYRKTAISVKNIYHEDVAVMSNPGALSQIISNLLMNSMTHAFEDGESGEISIRIERNNDILNVIYADTGKGIAKDYLKRIFEPFFTTKRSSGGSGLGLYITYNLVTQSLKGSITCSSAPGKGARFIISLPINRNMESK